MAEIETEIRNEMATCRDQVDTLFYAVGESCDLSDCMRYCIQDLKDDLESLVEMHESGVVETA